MICTDETDCDWEKVTLCAFDAAGSTVGGALAPTASAFLECMDSSKLPLFYDESIPKGCAGTVGLDWSGIKGCFGGTHGTALLKSAAARVTAQFGEKSFGLPTVVVDGKAVCPVA